MNDLRELSTKTWKFIMAMIKDCCLDVTGLGVIFYSPFSTTSIVEGEDYLQSGFFDPKIVEEQAREGRIVGVSTGTPGRFLLTMYDGYPNNSELNNYAYKLRLGVEVRDRTLCVRDLYDLMEWTAECPPAQTIQIDDGFYHITLLSNAPPSGILGDDQAVDVYLQKLPQMPILYFSGVPTLC